MAQPGDCKPRVQRDRRRDGTLFSFASWSAYDSKGEWMGAFETWSEAMRWATDPTARLEYFANRTRVRP